MTPKTIKKGVFYFLFLKKMLLNKNKAKEGYLCEQTNLFYL